MTIVRVLLVPLLVGLLAFGIGFLDVKWGTSDTRWLSAKEQSTLTGAPGVAPDITDGQLGGDTSASSTVGGGTDGGSLDAVEAAGSHATGPTDTNGQLVRDEIYTACLQWLGLLVATGTVLAAAWLAQAERLHLRLGGPTGYGRARTSWVVLLLIVILVSAPTSWLAYENFRLGETMASQSFIYRTGLYSLLGVGIYWIATAIGALPVMRPAIPLAGRLPAGWR